MQTVADLVKEFLSSALWNPTLNTVVLRLGELVVILNRVDLFERSFCAERYVLTGTNGKYRQLFKFTLARSATICDIQFLQFF
jgi:hypothetical protein